MQYLKRNRLSAQDYIEGVLKGDKVVLSRAITLIESQLGADKELSMEVLEGILPQTGSAKRIGITGVPGVGKSTFIEALGEHLIARGCKVAVLAVDPSSQRSKGSILGDKTRMPGLSNSPQAFIRPSAAGTSLGGVAHNTREALLLCEAAGYDIVLVETIGVGQSETLVHNMVDFFLLLKLAGAGDELQGIKKGIMEMADAVVITKADGANQKAAKEAQATFQGALHLLLSSGSEWMPPVLTCSALNGTGIDEIWQTVEKHHGWMTEQSLFSSKRASQRMSWMQECVRRELDQSISSDPRMFSKMEGMKQQVMEGSLLPAKAAQELLRGLFK